MRECITGPKWSHVTIAACGLVVQLLQFQWIGGQKGTHKNNIDPDECLNALLLLRPEVLWPVLRPEVLRPEQSVFVALFLVFLVFLMNWTT